MFFLLIMSKTNISIKKKQELEINAQVELVTSRNS